MGVRERLDVNNMANKCGLAHPDMAVYFTCRIRYGVPKVHHSMDDFYLLIWTHSEDDPVGIVEGFCAASHKFDSESMALLKAVLIAHCT